MSVVALLGRARGRGLLDGGLLHLERRLCLVGRAHEVSEEFGLLQQELEPLAAAAVGHVRRGRDFGRSGHRRRRGRLVRVGGGARHHVEL